MASSDREIKFDEILRTLLERQKATMTQKKLAKALGVSGTTVSHYVTGRIRPSFQALVAIAQFFNVTLDYLVFGERVASAATADSDSLRTEVMRALAESDAHRGRQRDLIMRVNRRLFEHVEEVARELLTDRENFSPPGFLTDAETMALESCSRRTRVVVRTAPADIVFGPDGQASQGAYFDTLVANIRAKGTYQYLFYGARSQFEPYVHTYRSMLHDADIPSDQVDDQVAFRVVDAELPTGLVFLDLDQDRLERREPVLWERLNEDGIVDGVFGYVSVRHRESLGGLVLYPPYFASALRTFDRDWAVAREL